MGILSVLCFASAASAFDPLNGDFSKDDPLDVRIVAYNHNRNFIEDSNTDAEFDRILIALNPDIICFEEFTSAVSPSMIANRLDSILPISGGGSWQIHFGLYGGIRTVLCSRYPLSLQRIDTIPAASTRGVTMALADLPDADYPVDVYLLGVHLKCCGNAGGSEDAKRQDSADAITNWLADARGVARSSGDNISLPANTPMIALGDFNLVGGPQPESTLIDGNIQDEGQYGTDVKGDWDVSDMTNLNPLDPFTGDNFTWQGSTSFAPSPLDRMFYTDSALTVANSFVLNTNTMSAPALANAGLQAGDTLKQNSSDHLPIVLDMRLATTPQCGTDPDCDDGDFCNGAETCVAGTCQPGTPMICDDGNECTIDVCNPVFGCVTTDNNGTTCDDGDPCSVNDTCSAGACAGVPKTCDDGNACTTDSCDAGTGTCQFVPNNGVSCNDSDLCTLNDTCSAGACVGTPKNCDDGIGCTTDICNSPTGSCLSIPDDAACQNGVFCDGAEVCDTQADCQPGTPPCGVGFWCDETPQACNALGDGDFDTDGDIDLIDFSALQICFGTLGVGPCGPGNIVGTDGMIDLNDVDAFVNVLGGP